MSNRRLIIVSVSWFIIVSVVGSVAILKRLANREQEEDVADLRQAKVMTIEEDSVDVQFVDSETCVIRIGAHPYVRVTWDTAFSLRQAIDEEHMRKRKYYDREDGD